MNLGAPSAEKADSAAPDNKENNMNTLTEAINQLVQEKTFSLDAVDAIKGLRDKAAALENLCNTQNQQIADLGNTELRQTSRIGELQTEVANWKKREDELVQREKAAAEAIHEAKRQQAIADTFRESMGMIFRPNTVRETIQRSVPVAVEGSNGCAGFVSTYPETSSVERTAG